MSKRKEFEVVLPGEDVSQEGIRLELAASAKPSAIVLAQQFGYDGPLTQGYIEDEIRAYQRRTVEVCLESSEAKPRGWSWRTSKSWATVTVVLGFISFLSISGLSEFIYFQF